MVWVESLIATVLVSWWSGASQVSPVLPRVGRSRSGRGGGRGAGEWLTGAVVRRHGAEPWRMTAADYLAGLADRGDIPEGDEHLRLAGRPVPTPWDPALADAMRERGSAVYEEAVAGSPVADLRG